jgi:hypothetical protein
VTGTRWPGSSAIPSRFPLLLDRPGVLLVGRTSSSNRAGIAVHSEVVQARQVEECAVFDVRIEELVTPVEDVPATARRG